MVQLKMKHLLKKLHCLLLLTFFVLISCSLKVNADPGKIVGGYDILINQVPYIVSLQYLYEHECGGTIITEWFILTAAHCIDGETDLAYWTAMAGSTYHEGPGDRIELEYAVPHPKYDPDTLDLDASLVKMARMPLYGILPIKPLPVTSEDVKTDQNVIISGWGLTNEYESDYSPNLRYVWVKVINHTLCKSLFEPDVVTENMFCAGYLEGGKDACYGDSGGPAAVRENFLVGIISWGPECGMPMQPGMYTNVYKLLNWIKKETNAIRQDKEDKDEGVDEEDDEAEDEDEGEEDQYESQ